MKRAPIFTFLPLLSFATLAGLGGCGPDGPVPTEGNGHNGGVELSLSTVPSDANCLRVVATGDRTVTRLFDLSPGSTPTFSLDRLPAGIVHVDGQAFAAACSSLGATSVPVWVAAAPVPVRIEPLIVVRVVLQLIRNGRAAVSIDFETPPWISLSRAPVDLAVFGDAPYGAAQVTDFPAFIADINAALPVVSQIVHLGDIKNGSSRCDTSYFQFVVDNLNASVRPLLFTPGDNEWTDCHRANNGAYDPLERLATLRSLFFPVPGLSLGTSKKQVLSQAFFAGTETFSENQLWVEAGAVFSLVHVVGSNNGLLPWFGDDATGTRMDDPARRTAEEAARTSANLSWLDRTFAIATQQAAATVVVMMQANMWDGTPVDGFNSTVQKLAALTVAFGKPVLLLEGDSHMFLVDNPLAMGDAAHGVTTPVPNLTRVVVQGSTTTPLPEWLRVRVDPTATPPFSWTRVPR